jgi:hypothetical protein
MKEPPTKGTILLDTNLWLTACACASSEGPDNNSPFDRKTRSNTTNPSQARGAIIMGLKNNFTIVPEKVVEELQGMALSGEMSAKNRTHIRILQEMLGRETHTPISRADIEEQNQLFKQIEARAKKAGENPTLQNLACAKTWKKIREHAIDAETALKACPEAGPLPHTKTLGELEELKRRKKELTGTPEKTKDYFKKIVNLETKARRQKPFVLPDLEILICAEQTKATIFSKDADIAVLWGCSSERFQKTMGKPVVIGGLQGPEATFQEFVQATRKSARKHPPKEHEPEI